VARCRCRLHRLAGAEVLCDSSTGVLQPLEPTEMQKAVFHTIHDLAHPGTRVTRRLVEGRFMWRGCASDMAQWCR
jgi:Integrase zinc binding domain